MLIPRDILHTKRGIEKNFSYIRECDSKICFYFLTWNIRSTFWRTPSWSKLGSENFPISSYTAVTMSVISSLVMQPSPLISYSENVQRSFSSIEPRDNILKPVTKSWNIKIIIDHNNINVTVKHLSHCVKMLVFCNICTSYLYCLLLKCTANVLLFLEFSCFTAFLLVLCKKAWNCI